jgi:type I restriction enzyme S subunit
MELKLDKSTWKPVTFGDVVQEVRTTIKDPKGEGIERVVGLEHIETENIHLSKWASIEEDTTFTKGFKKGHVLFGRRRAYLKKAAQAGFDGICSGDITVMEAKDELLPELLPFLVCNDKFFDYAVKHSAGGLSPRTKFKDLANYEFLLPPKDQQAKLAELLWAADAAACKSFYLHAASIQNGTALLKQTFFELKARTTRSCLGEIGHWSSGGTPSKKIKAIGGMDQFLGLVRKM